MSPVTGAAGKASSAGTYDATLKGTDNHPADRALAARLAEICPELGRVARANRDYLGAAVLLAASHLGVRQFLDLGCGFPARGGVLESVLATADDTRIACVDSDRDIADPRYGYQAVLDEQGITRARMVLADLTKPDQVTGHPAMAGLIDSGQPVMVILGAVLHYWDAAEGRRIIAGYMDWLPPGSAAAVTVVACPDRARYEAMRQAWRAGTGFGYSDLHSDDDSVVAGLFGDLIMLNPGAGPVAGVRQAGQPRTRAYLAGGIGIKRKALAAVLLLGGGERLVEQDHGGGIEREAARPRVGGEPVLQRRDDAQCQHHLLGLLRLLIPA